MSIYIDENNTFKRHYLEIEKYIPQLKYNPYINELKQDIHNQKFIILTKCIDSKYSHYISKLNIQTIDYIFEQFYNEENFYILNDIFYKITYNNIKNINNYIFNYINSDTLLQEKLCNYTLEPTPIKISTMTICCFLDKLIDLKSFYDIFNSPYNINMSNYEQVYNKLKPYDIIGCKYDNTQKGYFKKNTTRSFFNCASLNIYIHKNKQINFKIFKNGKIQITGIPNEVIAKNCIKHFILYLKAKNIIKNIIKYNNFRTVLINSDFFCGIEINRENFYKILTKKLNLNVSYESESYPGVKLGYFYNKCYTSKQNEGVCNCETKCKGKGAKSKFNICKRITISTFQSGKIIITGASSYDQIECAYNFINNIIFNNYYLIKKKNIKKIKTFKIKTKNINNYNDYLELLIL